MRTSTGADRVVAQIDQVLRSLTGNIGPTARPNPAAGLQADQLPVAERLQAGRLMRVNHCGEVCAQALYLGQSLASRDRQTVKVMTQAAGEEIDHLAWCEQRLAELDTPVSRLNPLFFAASFATGVAAALAGDKLNLGFLAATEEQVATHLAEHIEQLPANDHRTRAILEQMKKDEDAHRRTALKRGGIPFPRALKRLMTSLSRVMTRTSYWV